MKSKMADELRLEFLQSEMNDTIDMPFHHCLVEMSIGVAMLDSLGGYWCIDIV